MEKFICLTIRAKKLYSDFLQNKIQKVLKYKL